jgi:hypothetical protein
MIRRGSVPGIVLGVMAFLFSLRPLWATDPCAPPAAPEGMFKIENGAAPPGGEVALAFSIRGNFDVAALSFSVDFDEEVLQATGVERIYRRPDGMDFSFEKLGFNNSNATPGNEGVDEGYLGGAAVFNVRSAEGQIPANQEQEVYRLHFRVRPEASGQITEIRFLNGAMIKTSETPIWNTMNGCGFSMRPDMDPAFVLLSGFLQVLPDVTAFLRGDSNGDGQVDLSEAQRTFNYLFLGDREPACYDAADANDDGKLDVSDAVFTLRVLFLGEGAMPEPAGEPGPDPTPDSLGCLFRS